MALLFGWNFTSKGRMVTAVITGTPVAGVSMVTVNSDQTQLTLSGVQRKVDRAMQWWCTLHLHPLLRSSSDPATINVQCMYKQPP